MIRCYPAISKGWLLAVYLVLARVLAADGYCDYRGQPSQVIVNTSGVYVDGTYFRIKGVGYSPIYPGIRTREEPFDYFTHRYRHIWQRDLPLIKALGANAMRLWSWDATADHRDFLDLAYAQGLMVLVPFDLTPQNYPDLTDAKVRKEAVIDWKAFVQSIEAHPAVLGYLIGNEGDTKYQDQIDAFFTIVNTFVETARQIEGKYSHPITVPLSDKALPMYVTKYYPWLKIDFWSVQAYRPDLSPVYTEYMSAIAASGLHSQSPKPLVFTEFGVDALGKDGETPASKPVEDQSKQASGLCKQWQDIETAPIPTGGFVMEYVDEWWKGGFADVRHDFCPNQRTDVHTYCAIDLLANHSAAATLLHEEWLGLFSQASVDFQTSSGRRRYCIEPRLAYCTIQNFWTGKDQSCIAPTECNSSAISPLHFGQEHLYVTYEDGMICAVPRSIWHFGWSVWIMGIVVIVMLLLFASYINPGWWRSGQMEDYLPNEAEDGAGLASDQKEEDDAEEGSDHGDTDRLLPFSESQRDQEDADVKVRLESYAATFIPYQSPSGGEAMVLRTEIGHAFGLYTPCSDFFPVLQERIFSLIWDRYMLVTDIHVATRCVYELMLEGLFVYKNSKPPKSLPLADMLQDLALYTIVSQWAGTINHSPEKVCEVYEFSRDYLQYRLQDASKPLRDHVLKEFHHALVEIFRVYYLKIDGGSTFEDVNMDAISNRFVNSTKFDPNDERLEGGFNINTVVSSCSLSPTVSATSPQPSFNSDCYLLPETELQESTMPAILEYHMHSMPEERVSSTMAKLYFGSRKHFTPYFPGKAGVSTLIANYSWMIRMMLWMWMMAWYLQPTYVVSLQFCFSDLLQWLAAMDSLWIWISLCLEQRILAKWEISIIVQILIHTLTTAMFLSTLVRSYFDSFPSLTYSFDAYFKHIFSTQTMGTSVLFTIFAEFEVVYLGLQVVMTLFKEFKLFGSGSAPYPVAGRLRPRSQNVQLVRILFGAVFLITTTLGFSLWPLLKQDYQFGITWWPTMLQDSWPFVVFFLALSLAVLVAQRGVKRGDTSKEGQRQKVEEISYLAGNTIFWFCFCTANFVIMAQLVLPSIIKVKPNVCFSECGDKNILSSTAFRDCELRAQVVCIFGVLFLWLSTILSCFAITYAVYQALVLLVGMARGKILRIGGIQSWRDVAHFDQIRCKGLPFISSALYNPEHQDKVWNLFVQSLHDEFLLTSADCERLLISDEGGVPDFSNPPRNGEARRRIKTWLWSLESMMGQPQKSPQTPFNQAHRVRSMPSLTVIVPAYNEPIIFSEQQLRKSWTGNKSRISELEYLVYTYQDEWESFAAKVGKEDPTWVRNHEDPAHDLLHSFLGNNKVQLSPAINLEIRFWASCRGQTLSRTIAGLMNCRNGLLELARMEEVNLSQSAIEELVHHKFQVIISHQTFDPSKDYCKQEAVNEEDMALMFKKFKFFELVYNVDSRFLSVRRRLKQEVLFRSDNNKWEFDSFVAYPGAKNGKKHCLYKTFASEDFHEDAIQRVGRLKIGEGKAENQMHALAFARGQVIQTNDMNMYFTIDNALKVPSVLFSYFSIPNNMTGDNWNHHRLAPPVRLLGFTEHCYSRTLSIVGDMMGAAEFSFVTIFHRALNWPLRTRLHYGHPDFFCGYWVRTRGGTSKASPIVHTNEDIFAGYEIVGRGESMDYVEFLEAQKGRESAFAAAFTFEAKLAQGAAQQSRSLDVFWMNRRLDFFARISMFYGTLAFYVTNFIMSISIKYYALSMVMAAIGRLSYHQLGLLDAVVAVPWLFQIGYVMGLPLLAEMYVRRGLWRALASFIATLPVSLIFFAFHLRTKAYFFSQGLLLGKGGYSATGRGFGLDRLTLIQMYKIFSESHYHEGIVLLGYAILYALTSGDPIVPFLLRFGSIISIILSWIAAPSFFNPVPSFGDLRTEAADYRWWIGQNFSEKKDPKKAKKLEKELVSMHVVRIREAVPITAGKSPKEKLIGSYWGKGKMALDNTSWLAWWWKDVLISAWEAEDLFFSSFPSRVFQEIYFKLVAFAPVILIAFRYWHANSINYLFLIVLCVAFLHLAEHALQRHHEHMLVVKFCLVLCFAPAWFNFTEGNMLGLELLSSLVCYVLLLWLICEAILGLSNWRAKSKVKISFPDARDVADLEFLDTELASSDFNIRLELHQAFQAELKEFRLFLLRMEISGKLVLFHNIKPAVVMVALVIVNTILVFFSETITSIMFNSRVAECWKIASMKASHGNDDDPQAYVQGARVGTFRSEVNRRSHSGRARPDELVPRRNRKNRMQSGPFADIYG